MNDQGLRVSLYDGENTLEALGDNAVVDVWYYSKPSGATKLEGGNNKKGVPASEDKMCENILSMEGLGGMPMPIGWDNATGSFTAQGDELRDYLLGDGSYYEPPSGSGGSGGSSGGTPIIWSGGGSSGPTAGQLLADASNAEERAAAVDSLISKNKDYISLMVDREVEKLAVNTLEGGC